MQSNALNTGVLYLIKQLVSTSYRLIYSLPGYWLRKRVPIHGLLCVSAYESFRGSRLAPGPTVTRPGQIPHPGAQVLRLVKANFDRRLFESKEICTLWPAASAATQGEEFTCVCVRSRDVWRVSHQSFLACRVKPWPGDLRLHEQFYRAMPSP